MNVKGQRDCILEEWRLLLLLLLPFPHVPYSVWAHTAANIRTCPS